MNPLLVCFVVILFLLGDDPRNAVSTDNVPPPGDEPDSIAEEVPQVANATVANTTIADYLRKKAEEFRLQQILYNAFPESSPSSLGRMLLSFVFLLDFLFFFSCLCGLASALSSRQQEDLRASILRQANDLINRRLADQPSSNRDRPSSNERSSEVNFFEKLFSHMGFSFCCVFLVSKP